MRTRFARPIALAAVASVLLAGCGGDGASTAGATSPEGYARGICGAASRWVTGLEDRNVQLQGDLPAVSTDPAALQDLMVAFLDGAVQETETLIEEVSALSPPDVDGGQEVHDAAISAFTQARDLFAGARDQIAALDPSDQEGFARALTDLGTTLGEAGSGIADSVQGLTSPELEAAFDGTPECDEVAAAQNP